MKRYGFSSREVVRLFVAGRGAGTGAAPVPGGRRVESVVTGEGTADLYSYRTVVARRLPNGNVAITPKRYSTSTSKLVGYLRRVLWERGFAESSIEEPVEAAVPGRWGGFGPAWHPTGWESLPFVVWRMPGNGIPA